MSYNFCIPCHKLYGNFTLALVAASRFFLIRGTLQVEGCIKLHSVSVPSVLFCEAHVYSHKNISL